MLSEIRVDLQIQNGRLFLELPQIQKWMKAQSPPVTSFADLVCTAPSRTPSPWL